MRLRRKSAGLKNLLCIPPLAEWKKLEINFVYCVLRTPNRRLLSRKTEFEFVRPYDLIPKYRAFCEARPAPASPCGINSGGASQQSNAPQFSKCLNWSQLLNEARTFFERNSDWLPRFARLKLNARAGKKEGGWGEGIFARPRFPIPIFPPPNFVPVKLARRRRILLLANKILNKIWQGRFSHLLPFLIC